MLLIGRNKSMSTRGWYEYYVIDPTSECMSLAMQFYKWGDATPENTLSEWQFLQGQIEQAQGRLPIIWLDDLLREQLHELYGGLPRHFSVGAFLFLLQRAAEELSPYRQSRYWDLPKEQRPDYRLGFAIGEAMALNGVPVRAHPDPHLDRVLSFIAAGHLVRQWKDYGLKWSVLRWLQYLTQVTLETDMGSIAGDFNPPVFDISFIYRFFIWSRPNELFGIDRLAVDLCDSRGDDLLSRLRQGNDRNEEEEEEYDRRWADSLSRHIETLGVDTYSLTEARKGFAPIPDQFWGSRCYERPEPIVQASRRA